MSNLTIRLTEEERNILNSISHLYGGNISKTVKRLLFANLEEEYDLEIMKNFDQRYQEGEARLVSFEDAKKKLGM